MSETVRRFATTVTWILKSGERGGGERRKERGERGEKEMRRIDVERGEEGRERHV